MTATAAVPWRCWPNMLLSLFVRERQRTALGIDGRMTFTWDVPPWQRNVDCTYLAVMIADVGDVQVSLNTQSVRGDDATEALADLLMGPGGAGNAMVLAGLVGVVVRRGIDVMWMAQPPIKVAAAGDGGWEISVDAAEDVTVFSTAEARDLLARLKAQYASG